MRSRFFVLTLLLTFIGAGVFAQCNPYFAFEKGTSFTLTNYNKKGKIEGSQDITIKNVTQVGSKQLIDAYSKAYDKKGSELIEGDYQLTCENGAITMDMRRFAMANSSMAEVEGVSIEIDGDLAEIPASLSVGQTLKEAVITSKVNFEESQMPNMPGMGSSTITVHDRKVVGKETVSTPAGSYECYKITYKTTIEFKIMGMKRKTETGGADWIAEGIGMVKNEFYDKKGGLTGYTLLTKYSK